MKINKIQNNGQIPTFGTRIGSTLQDKIALGKARGVFSNQQCETITKIENDGLPVVLDIVDKIIIKRVNNKSSMCLEKHMALIDESKERVTIDNLSAVYKPRTDNKLCFSLDNFAKLFSDEYNLAGKIEEVYKSLTQKK